VDRLRDMTELIGAYRDYAKAPKIELKLSRLDSRVFHAPLFNIITYSGKQCTQRKRAKVQLLQDPNQAI